MAATKGVELGVMDMQRVTPAGVEAHDPTEADAGAEQSPLTSPASLCDCCSRAETGNLHLPLHPRTWRRSSSHAAVPWFTHSHAQYRIPDGLSLRWNSRSHRKGRSPVLLHADGSKLPTRRPPLVLLNLDVTNVSWWLGCIFTLASAVWVVNGVYSIAPLDDVTTNNRITGICALIGGAMFIVGGYLAVLESVNAPPTLDHAYVVYKNSHYLDKSATKKNSGSKLNRNPSSDLDRWSAKAVAVATKKCHGYKHTQASLLDGCRTGTDGVSANADGSEIHWHWFGWQPRSLGYVANLLVLMGALIFYIPCITGYYKVLNTLSPAAEAVLYWLPQVVASVLFVVSPALTMLEVQETWYMPRVQNLGWHAAFWNCVGGWGFLLCGAFGFAYSDPGIAKWGVALSTLWGSVAFLVGSLLQWVECMNPHALGV